MYCFINCTYKENFALGIIVCKITGNLADMNETEIKKTLK